MSDFAAPLQRLIDEFRRLPGIGQKSAQTLAFHVLRTSREDALRLSTALLDVKDNLGICAECNNISDAELCPYCRDPNRDRTSVCVVDLIPVSVQVAVTETPGTTEPVGSLAVPEMRPNTWPKAMGPLSNANRSAAVA